MRTFSVSAASLCLGLSLSQSFLLRNRDAHQPSRPPAQQPSDPGLLGCLQLWTPHRLQVEEGSVTPGNIEARFPRTEGIDAGENQAWSGAPRSLVLSPEGAPREQDFRGRRPCSHCTLGRERIPWASRAAPNTLTLGDHREDLAPHRMPEGGPNDSPPAGHPVSQVGGTWLVRMFSRVCNLGLAKASCLAETSNTILGLDRRNLNRPREA